MLYKTIFVLLDYLVVSSLAQDDVAPPYESIGDLMDRLETNPDWKGARLLRIERDGTRPLLPLRKKPHDNDYEISYSDRSSEEEANKTTTLLSETTTEESESYHSSEYKTGSESEFGDSDESDEYRA